MSTSLKLYIKLYYLFWNVILPKRQINLPSTGLNKKNIFLYFDYEREFGGHNTSITNKDIDVLLSALNKHSFKTTWFTVGKIFEKYPDTIREIVNQGHEVGSHTYGHVSPLKSKNIDLSIDFKLFNTYSPLKVKGFHSPNGQWSFKMLKYLNHYNFSYDVISKKKRCKTLPFRVVTGFNRSIIRLYTTGDDWQLYSSNYSENDVLNFLINKTQQIGIGEIGGIGFHPWVLFSNENIFKGFERYLNYLSGQADIRVEPAISYVNLLSKPADLNHK